MAVLSKIQNLTLPLPVTLTTCRAKQDDGSTDNMIPLAWVGIVEYKPPMVNIVIGSGKYSAVIIEKRREFGLCIATLELMDKVDMCGYTHGDKVDKFKMTGLTKMRAEKIDVPLIEECPICLECAVKESVRLKTHTVFIAEVLLTHVDDKYLKSGEEPDLGKMNLLCYANDQYWSLGRKLQDLYYTKR